MDVHPIKNGINRYWSIPIWGERWARTGNIYQQLQKFRIVPTLLIELQKGWKAKTCGLSNGGCLKWFFLGKRPSSIQLRGTPIDPYCLFRSHTREKVPSSATSPDSRTSLSFLGWNRPGTSSPVVHHPICKTGTLDLGTIKSHLDHVGSLRMLKVDRPFNLRYIDF